MTWSKERGGRGQLYAGEKHFGRVWDNRRDASISRLIPTDVDDKPFKATCRVEPESNLPRWEMSAFATEAEAKTWVESWKPRRLT